MNRRSFIQISSSAVAFAALSPASFAQDEKPAKRALKKGMMLGTVGYPGSLLDKFKAIKAAGFDGVEPASHLDQDEVLKARDAAGLEIPSVCCDTHWKKPLSDPNPEIRAEGLAGLKQALRDAKRYGADSVLLVPGMVNEHIAYDDAYRRTQEEIRKALPLAEELGVKIAFENVWNNFLISPMEAARFVDEFNSPMVGWHFDVGNILRYGWPEQWIEILGRRIAKVHAKEFSRKKMNDNGLREGFQVQYLEGDCNWRKVMKALDAVPYSGWLIAEPAYAKPAVDAEGLKNIADRLDKIIRS